MNVTDITENIELAHPNGGRITVHLPMGVTLCAGVFNALANLGFDFDRNGGDSDARADA